MREPEYCERCRRPAPPWESSEYSSWEASTRDDGSAAIICPGCITGEQQQAMIEDVMDMVEEIERRRAPGYDG